jgi:hypothetical protein
MKVIAPLRVWSSSIDDVSFVIRRVLKTTLDTPEYFCRKKRKQLRRLSTIFLNISDVGKTKWLADLEGALDDACRVELMHDVFLPLASFHDVFLCQRSVGDVGIPQKISCSCRPTQTIL